MATIHEFRALPRDSSVPRSVSAEIIIFPGIRYEYWSAEPVRGGSEKKARRSKPAKPRRGRRVKRDFLEIA